jgi:hypothetical protein
VRLLAEALMEAACGMTGDSGRELGADEARLDEADAW